jgi:hypothetical protein
MPQKISGIFDTRREAEMAIERFVQTHGLERGKIEVMPAGDENTVGTEIAGSDAKRGPVAPPPNDDAALNGRVRVSIDRDEADMALAREVYEEFKAVDIRITG